MRRFGYVAFMLLISIELVDGATYLYRVPVVFGSKSQVKGLGDTVGRDGREQPFVGTYVLTPPDTNYLLLKVTADNDPGFEGQGFDLYQIQKIDDSGFIVNAVDNSKTFAVDKDWKVGVSSK